MRYRHLAAACAAAHLAACGGGGSPSGPSGPSTPTPTTPPGFTVAGFVFYDQNANGILDAGEDVRIPNATVTVGTRSGQTTGNGTFNVEGVAEGSQTASVDATSLPSYYVPGEPIAVAAPQPSGSSAAVPVVLDIGRNRAHMYMAYGDSISTGLGSRSGEGYRDWLVFDLRNYFGRADIADAGDPGSASNQGVERMGLSLNTIKPAFSLIMYGTNDWTRSACTGTVGRPCFTVDSLRHMIGLARSVRSKPIIATIPPANPDRVPPERLAWIEETNELIKAMAAEENTIVADVHAAMVAAGPLPDQFTDHVHPNDEGYRTIARAFFVALTDSSLRTTSAPAFGFVGPEVSTD